MRDKTGCCCTPADYMPPYVKEPTHGVSSVSRFVHERSMNLFNQLHSSVRRLRVWQGQCSREIGIAQFVFFAFVHKQSRSKSILLRRFRLSISTRTPVYNLRFQFELNYRNRLVHLRNQPQCLFVVIGIGKVHLRSKDSNDHPHRYPLRR